MKNFILLFLTLSILFIQGCATESKDKEKTTAPIFSKTSGVYTNSSELTINSNTQGAKIYYTLNGAEPDSKNGILYQNSLKITSTAIIKAIATKDNFENSETSTIQLTIIQKYILIFDSNGGTTISAISEIAPDSTISTPVAPTKSGNTFAGWYKEPSLLNKWMFESDKVTSDTTLYAKWTISGMVLVPSGTTSASNGSVTVDKDFYISKYETTQAEFQEIMGFNPSSSKVNSEKYPVEKVNWYDSVSYCNKKSIAEGLEPCYNITNVVYEGAVDLSGITSATVTEITGAKGYRLPTVKEWEYATRGGKNGVGYTYSGSNNPAEVSWYLNNSANKTHAVGGKAPNELGLYDMSGNVWEWTMPTPQNNNIRGGCFSSAIHIAVSQWWYYSPNYKDDRGGFRIARSAM